MIKYVMATIMLIVAVSRFPAMPKYMNKLSEPFRKSLEDAAFYAASLGLDIRTIHRIGEPGVEIIRIAEEEEVDLIVLGNEKLSKMEQVLLRGTRAKVVDGSPCDIMPVPEMSEIRFGKILVGFE